MDKLIRISTSLAAIPLLAIFALAGCSDQDDQPLALELSSAANIVTIGNCEFDDDAAGVLALQGDCTTDQTIPVPDGYTLDGSGHTITAVDPAGGAFQGAVIQNAGSSAWVTDVTITADNLSSECKSGEDRLRGIMFDGASGAITRSSVIGINMGASGCQEGNGIEIRNAPFFDGTHPNTMTVEIANTTVDAYQKTGIVANGDVNVSIHHNDVGASATQENLAANSVQLGFGALGSVVHNTIEGNQWMGTSDFAAAAVLAFDSDVVEVSKNNIRGNSDIGLLISTAADVASTFDNNRIFDEGADHPASGYDIGIVNFDPENSYTNNKIRGFDTPIDGSDVDDNKVIGSPNM